MFSYGPQSLEGIVVTPWGRQAFEAWELVSTQQRVASGMEVFPLGLDYVACAVVLERYGLDDIEVWEGIRILERQWLKASSRKRS